jgi:hypothetical protein
METLHTHHDQLQKELELELKKLELKERRFQLDMAMDQRCRDDRDKLNIEKLGVLQYLLTSSMVDIERTIVGSEPAMKPTFEEEDAQIIRAKIMEIVRKL